MESLLMKKLQQVLPLVLCQVLRTFHQNPHPNIFLESKSTSKLLVPSFSPDFLHSTDSTFPSSKSSAFSLFAPGGFNFWMWRDQVCFRKLLAKVCQCLFKRCRHKTLKFWKAWKYLRRICHLSFPGQVDQNIAVQALEAGNESVYCGIQKLNCLSQVSQGCHLHSATWSVKATSIWKDVFVDEGVFQKSKLVKTPRNLHSQRFFAHFRGHVAHRHWAIACCFARQWIHRALGEAGKKVLESSGKVMFEAFFFQLSSQDLADLQISSEKKQLFQLVWSYGP